MPDETTIDGEVVALVMCLNCLSQPRGQVHTTGIPCAVQLAIRPFKHSWNSATLVYPAVQWSFCELQRLLLTMSTKLNTEIVAAAIAGFEEQKKRLNARIAELRQMLSPDGTDGTTPEPKKRRRMSAAARARIAAAQRKRWAESREQAGAASSTAPARKKRRLSGAGRKAIIEATKRRWAAFRKAQGK